MDEFAAKVREQAGALMQLARYDQAITMLMQAHLRDKGDTDTLTLLVRALIDGGYPAEAIPHAHALVEATPDDSYSYYLLAFAYYRKGDTYNAIDAALKSQSLDPNYVEVYALLSVTHGIRGHGEELRYANEGLAIEPTHYLCLCHRTRALLHLSRLPEMKETIDGAIQLYPESGYLHYMTGCYHSAIAQPYKALDFYRTALQLNPTGEGYEADMKDALYKANPLSYFQLQVERFGSTHLKKLGLTAAGLFVLDIALHQAHLPILFSVTFVLLLLAIYALSWLCRPIAWYYTNVYLMIRPATRYNVTAEEQRNTFIATLVAAGTLIWCIAVGNPAPIFVVVFFTLLIRRAIRVNGGF